uniref:Uncharacterized protein n=1 Tax=Crocodylus porosus TaxID=8502 RepID=A0A7M4DVP9_CROPO
MLIFTLCYRSLFSRAGVQMHGSGVGEVVSTPLCKTSGFTFCSDSINQLHHVPGKWLNLTTYDNEEVKGLFSISREDCCSTMHLDVSSLTEEDRQTGRYMCVTVAASAVLTEVGRSC